MADILKALAEGTDAAGGYVVPEVLAREVLPLVYAQTITLSDLDRRKMTSDTHLLPKLTSGQTAYWINENAEITGSDMAFGRTTLSAKKVAALTTISSELLEDAAADVAGAVTKDFSKRLALAIDGAILTGSGTPWSGLTASPDNHYSAGTLSWTDFIEGASLITQDDHEWPDVCYIHPINLKKLLLLTDSTGRPIFNAETYGSPALKSGVIGNILGMNVKQSTQMPTDKIILARSGEYGYYGDRRTLELHKFYQIKYDNFIYSAVMRVAFAKKYPNAYTVLTNVA